MLSTTRRQLLFAGAGVSKGAIHVASDRQGAYPSRDPVTLGKPINALVA